MVFSFIKTELRKDYIFLKKFLLFYLVISHAIITCKMEIFPDHFSEKDPNFSRGQAKKKTIQEFYYDLGYFTQKTEKYRSPKYGINYRPVQCHNISEKDPEPTYNPDDTDSFFGPDKGFNNIYSTLDDKNYFDDTKLFRNTITGYNFSCPSPIRAFHNTDKYEMILTIPMISKVSTTLHMYLVDYNESITYGYIGKVQLQANKYRKVTFFIVPNAKPDDVTEMSFYQNKTTETVVPISIYGDPDLYIHFISETGTDITLSNYRVTFSDSTTLTGEKYTTNMVRSKNGILHNCTKDNDCIMGFMCSNFNCLPCHSTCTECYQDDSNAAGMNYCRECNVLSNYLYPQDGYCDVGYVDMTLFQDFDVRVKPDSQEYNDRETLGFWIFFSNTEYSNLYRNPTNDNHDIIHHVVLKDRIVISMIQKIDKIDIYCHAYENIFSKNTSEIVYWRHDNPRKEDVSIPGYTRLIRGFYPDPNYHIKTTAPSEEQEKYLTQKNQNGEKTIDGHWMHISCAESFDHGLYYLKTVINGQMEYDERHLSPRPFDRTVDGNSVKLNVVNDKYFKPIINDDHVLYLSFHNFNYSNTRIYMRHLTLFKEYIPPKMQYMYFDYTDVSDFYELLYYIPFNHLTYGNEYKIKGYSYGYVEENIILTLNASNDQIIGDISPALNFKHLNLPKMNYKYKEIDLVLDEISPLIKKDEYKYVYDDDEPLCCYNYLNHDTNECDNTCVNFRRLPYEGVHENSGYCDYTCSDSMSCLKDHLDGDDLDYDAENGFCTSLSKAYNLFFRCEDDQIDYYLQFSGFYNSSRLEKIFPKMQSYIIEFWYYDDYFLKELAEKFFGDPTEEKHYVFYTNIFNLYFTIGTESLAYVKTGSRTVGSYYSSGHYINYEIKDSGSGNIPFFFQEWNRIYIAAYYNRTYEITKMRITLNYYDTPDDPPERRGGVSTIKYQPSEAAFERILFCHDTCKDWNGKTIHWATGYYKHLKIWDANNASPTILKQYELYYPDYENRVSALKYFFPLKNKYIANNKIIDPKNKESFTITVGKYNTKKYNFSSKFDLIAAQRYEGYCFLMDYENSHFNGASNQIRGRELVLKERCEEGCERCWCNEGAKHKDRCYKCKKGYFLDTEMHCFKIGTYYFKSPNLLNRNLDAEVSKITLIENKEAVTVTFWFKTFGFSADDHITMFTIK